MVRSHIQSKKQGNKKNWAEGGGGWEKNLKTGEEVSNVGSLHKIG